MTSILRVDTVFYLTTLWRPMRRPRSLRRFFWGVLLKYSLVALVSAAIGIAIWSSSFGRRVQVRLGIAPAVAAPVVAPLEDPKDVFCRSDVLSNDYAFSVRCLKPLHNMRVGNGSRRDHRVMVLTQDGFVHGFDVRAPETVWQQKLHLPDLLFGDLNGGAKGVHWVDENTFLISYTQKTAQCLRVALAEFRFLDTPSVTPLEPVRTRPITECLDLRQEIDLNGAGGAFLQVSPERFLLTIGAPEASSAAIRDLAQNPKSNFGKVVEFRRDRSSWLTGPISIFSSGHRNPQGLTQFANGLIFSSEHGPQGGDEINRLEVGKNYGWPLYSYGLHYPSDPEANQPFPLPNQNPAMTPPLYYFSPSVALTGMTALHGQALPRWQPAVLMTSLRAMTLFIVKFSTRFDRVQSIESLRFPSRLRWITQFEDQLIVVGEGSEVFILTMKTAL